MDKKKRGFELVKGYLTEQRKPKPDRAYLKSERVQEGLAKLPGWRLSRDGVALQQSRSSTTTRRRWRTSGSSAGWRRVTASRSRSGSTRRRWSFN